MYHVKIYEHVLWGLSDTLSQKLVVLVYRRFICMGTEGYLEQTRVHLLEKLLLSYFLLRLPYIVCSMMIFSTYLCFGQAS